MQASSSRLIVPIFRQLKPHPMAIRLVPHRTFFSRRPLRTALWDVEVPRHFDRQFEQMENELTSAFRNFGLNKNRFLPSSLSFERSHNNSPMTMYETETADKYTMNVVIGKDLLPENIKVNLKDREITVEAKFEQSYDYEDGTSKISQELVRTFTLPEGIDTSQVKSVLTQDGILQFEAPKPAKPIEEAKKAHEIPIITSN